MFMGHYMPTTVELHFFVLQHFSVCEVSISVVIWMVSCRNSLIMAIMMEPDNAPVKYWHFRNSFLCFSSSVPPNNYKCSSQLLELHGFCSDLHCYLSNFRQICSIEIDVQSNHVAELLQKPSFKNIFQKKQKPTS